MRYVVFNRRGWKFLKKEIHFNGISAHSGSIRNYRMGRPYGHQITIHLDVDSEWRSYTQLNGLKTGIGYYRTN